jgi:hypothetical protein
LKLTAAQQKVSDSILDALGVDDKPNPNGYYPSSPSPFYNTTQALDDKDDFDDAFEALVDTVFDRNKGA